MESTDESNSDQTPLVAAVPELVVDGLSFGYSREQLVLSDICLTVHPNERLALVGPSGAGKSTLLLHLNGLLPPRITRSGPASIRVGDASLIASNLNRIRQTVGLVFQDPDDQLFCPTVREDVGFGPQNLGLPDSEIADRVRQSLEDVGMAQAIDRSTLQLSYGERKRVCLAGVLACRPRILVLDEPSSNLDPRSRRGLIEILRNFEGSILMATHDLELVVELCQRVLVMDGGRIHQDGPVHEVLTNRDLMERHGLEVPLSLRCNCHDS